MKNECHNTTEAGVYAPRYYPMFQCIADRCRHNCCIGWEIGIDEETYEAYKQIEPIIKTVQMCEDGPCFVLKEDGRCPHLNDAGLCDIILTHGEGCLSEICANHPRFYHEINSRRMEAGLGIVCEEACRLILEYDEPFAFSKIDDFEGGDFDDEEPDFDILPQRARILAVIDSACRFDEKIAILKSAFAIPDRGCSEEWLARFLSLEILDANWKGTLQAMQGKLFRSHGEKFEAYEQYYARLLTYFVYRHVSVAHSMANLRARLAFCMLSVAMIRSLFEENTVYCLETLIDFSRRYSAEIEYSEDNTAALISVWEGWV